ncbi:hypothetical protein [Treponema sp. C6A8]|uniref:hypothetical protein n=1 Tax=Treponema sp. C6A8 TaxID=1410609 RepID=UPI000484C073|nr:hypothetical protein [Treponema sp. C6A8]
MATTANLSALIKYYADKQKSPFIDFKEFCTYIKKYADHHVEEQGELVKYLGDTAGTINAELQGLSEKHLVAVTTNGNKKMIVAFNFFVARYTAQFNEILKNDSTPYPLVSDLPKQFPLTAIERKAATSYIPSLIEKDTSKTNQLLFLEFSQEIPPLILPSCISMQLLIETAQQKIRRILKKEEYHDYFLKKLRSTNPTKEVPIRGFYSKFVDANENNFSQLADGDDYYFWNQLLYFIKQDYIKIQDRTTDDVNILQAVLIAEIHSSYLKSKFQDNKKKRDALNELEASLGKPPYFFSMNQILKFKDKSGQDLYGIYTEEDLKKTLQRLTTEGEANELPPLLVFKVSSGTRYFVYKKNVLNVVVRLCNEGHDSIERALEEKWFNVLMDHEKLPEMTNLSHFENTLHKMVEANSPVLHALLSANFMTLLAFDTDESEMPQGFRLFVNGKLLPYHDLLMLKNAKILANAKARLPFYYTMPIISWLFALFTSGKRQQEKEARKNEISNPFDELEEEPSRTNKKSRAEVLSAKAKDITQDMIPEGSTIDRELNYLEKQWNKRISKDAYNQLNEDVNALIRDYTRKILRTLSDSTFTKERIKNLAETLTAAPNMQKLGNNKALTEYVALYMLRLISNR